MAAKKKNTAKIAENNIKNLGNGAVEEVEPVQNIPEIETQENIPESLNQILSKVPQEQVAMVNQIVPGLIPYLSLQEQKVNWLIANMPTQEKVKEAFAQALKVSPSPVAAPTQQNPAGMAAMLPTLLNMVAGGGGGGDSEFAALGKQMLTVQIENMKAESDFTRSIKNAIVSRLTSKAVGGIESI